jgi:hypothetical protein
MIKLVDFPTIKNQCTMQKLEFVEDNATTYIRKLKEGEEKSEHTNGNETEFLNIHVSCRIFFLTRYILIATLLLVPDSKSYKANKVFCRKTSR